MPAYTQFFTTRTGARIAFAVLGSGPPLVYTPPVFGHLELMRRAPWFQTFDRLASEQFMLVRYDRYGCGLSDRGRTEFGLQVDVEVLADLIDHLGFQRVILLGAAGGGSVAVRYAVDNPGRVSHLLLFPFSWRPTGFTPIGTALNQLMRADWRIGVKARFDHLLADADPEVRRYLREMHLVAASPETALALEEAAQGEDLTEQLGRIASPTLVVTGDADATLESMREAAAIIPGARFRTLPGAAHLPEFHEAAAVLAVVLGFVKRAAHAAWESTDVLSPLSAREREVLKLVSAGLTNLEVATQLRISPHTVNSHLTNVYSKLGVPGRTAAVRLAVESGLIRQPPNR